MEQNDNHKALVLIIDLSIQNCKVLRDKMLEYCKIENKTHRSKELMDFIRRIHAEKFGPIVKRIFSYYKYFSQYEHFSEHAHGDTLASQIINHQSLIIHH